MEGRGGMGVGATGGKAELRGASLAHLLWKGQEGDRRQSSGRFCLQPGSGQAVAQY